MSSIQYISCKVCGYKVVENSKEHFAMLSDEFDENWFCCDCYDNWSGNDYTDEEENSDEEEEEEDKEDIKCCSINKNGEKCDDIATVNDEFCKRCFEINIGMYNEDE